MLPDGYSDVPAGKLAAVVTHLEMRKPPQPGHDPEQPGITLAHVEMPDTAWYRDLYARVGTDWLWDSRLRMAEADLSAILTDPDVEVYAVMKDGRAEGLLELDFREEGACELAFFGLTPAMVGNGTGRWLMNRAIARAWSRNGDAPIGRFWVHTCTLDSPQALNFYIRSGFVPVRRQVEVFDDPRLTGVLPETAAPQVPILRA
ncbi:GNAT family N-acetyltransferase [Shinella oryzae]|uniref:GNAT family N-acetyltransferase n=1 Tax=Shinella oryzae TaxID=2871820 RepID=UPI001FF541BF|nr:GNAT family N-acetyltransferase [Shinella oryzae]UPA23296.1 GNAT family N-acetyltransferase [Shinella oryzae]